MADSKQTTIQKWAPWSTEAAKAEQAALKPPAQYFKCPSGVNRMRFMPARPGGPVFVPTAMHFYQGLTMVRAAVFPCPRKLAGRPCPACEEADQLYRSGRDADQKVAKKMYPTKYAMCNVVARKEPDKGPQVWRMSPTIHKSLVAIRENEDLGGDITDPVQGFDINITAENEGIDRRYPVVQLATRNPTPLHPSQDVWMEWIDRMADLTQFKRIYTVAEIREMCAADGETSSDREAIDVTPSRGAVRTVQDDAGTADDDEIPF